MKINKLIKRFSLLAISYFCLTATHVAAQDFVEVKNQSKFAIIVRMGDVYSECMIKGEEFTYNLDEIGVKRGDDFDVVLEADWDCPFTKEPIWYPLNYCTKREHGKSTGTKSWRRATGSGTKIFVVRNNGNTARCAVQ